MNPRIVIFRATHRQWEVIFLEDLRDWYVCLCEEKRRRTRAEREGEREREANPPSSLPPVFCALDIAYFLAA
jgi:hypothetical protein